MITNKNIQWKLNINYWFIKLVNKLDIRNKKRKIYFILVWTKYWYIVATSNILYYFINKAKLIMRLINVYIFVGLFFLYVISYV